MTRSFDYFELFLSYVLNGNDGYKDLVNPVLVDAKKLALDRKAIFKLDAQNVTIVIYLIRKDRKYFSELDIENINNETYKHVHGLIVNAADIEPYA